MSTHNMFLWRNEKKLSQNYHLILLLYKSSGSLSQYLGYGTGKYNSFQLYPCYSCTYSVVGTFLLEKDAAC